jgi:hypothetical protein
MSHCESHTLTGGGGGDEQGTEGSVREQSLRWAIEDERNDARAELWRGDGYFRSGVEQLIARRISRDVPQPVCHSSLCLLSMSFLRLAVRNVARQRVTSAAPALAARTSFLQRAQYSAAAGLNKEQITTRVLELLKGFEKVKQEKVRHIYAATDTATEYITSGPAHSDRFLREGPRLRQFGCC